MSDVGLPTLQQIYEGFHGKVRAYAAKLIGREEADDTTQEVFIRVGRSLASLKDPAKLASWIYSITLNVVRDNARRRAVAAARAGAPAPSGRDDLAADDAFERVPDSGASSPEEDAMRRQMVACYLDYVEALPENYYDVYVLSELLELPDAEIARRLSLTLGTVKIRLHRARAQLHDQLRRDCECFSTDRGELLGGLKAGISRRRTGTRAVRKRARATS